MGGREVDESSRSRKVVNLSVRRKWLKTKEKWLVVVGVVLHAVYMLSIFDIYFKSPIVHGMDLVSPRFPAPAKRLVLLVADGLRADKFFESDAAGKFRAPFLRSVIKERGRWGVSHARPPTESRPGHVAIIAGFYEDPSAVTKGWKANPVEFDSVFNRSRHTFSYGSPDIVPIFCAALPHTTWNSYPHDFEDFATDASFLDEWSFDQFQSLMNRSKEDPKLNELLLQDNLVVFLHLLGCDSNGHAHRPFSSIYLNNVAVVDSIAERVYYLLEDYYKDNRTAYVFTADHGMHDKGSHGDGHPSNTDTPLVVWGAGVKHPKPISSSSHGDGHSDCGTRFVDDHMHDTPTPKEWGLHGIERVDVNQADIAPLMSTLLGLPCPVNSVGSLPLDYIDMKKTDEVEAVLANTKQVLNQFIRKSQTKEATSLYFKPFKPLGHYSSLLEQIEDHISNGDYEAARKLSENLRDLALQGLHYFQTYDWLMLMTVIILGYIGWMTYIVLHVLQSYMSLAGDILTKEHADHWTDYTRKNVRVDPPFRFQAMWMQLEEYKEFVTSAWNNTAGSLLEKTKGHATNLSTWNRDIFGNVFRKKTRLLARIAGVQKQLCLHENPFLQNLERDLIKQYELVRDQEALLWKQKSRDKWIQHGDRNTKFFHITTMVIRRRNKVDGLFAEDGTWSENPAVMKNIAESFFQNLFTFEEVPDLRFTIPNLFPTVELNNIKELAAPVCYQEIRSALFSIGGMKAPGFDGFPALFFQNHWELCKVAVIKIVTNAFIEGRIPEGLNHTLITLVPKVQGPKHMHLFRPISLCCTVYKIITKIIVSRIRPFLKKWISPNQVSFVPSRHISDNFMVTQEILHKCRYAKGKKGFLVWKIDLSKAYDKLNWSFINQVLYELQIPDQLTKLIMHCITSPSFQVILNGDLSDKFSAGRGVRQGDPLSPYIFVLCMEKLSHLIHSATEVGCPIQSLQSGPLVSHLFFADDIILFAEASTT